MHPQPSLVELYTPKLVTVLREPYGLAGLRADALAGLSVAIVALPLSMAIAIASGVGPERGLVAAIVGGFMVSALGGSRFQIGGPAGAFIVLVAGSVMQHGVDGTVLATLLAGLILLAIGVARLGIFIKYIPYPVTVGFTAGIAVIIAASQLKDFLGLSVTGAEPGPIIPKLVALAGALHTASPAALGVGALAIAIIVACRRLAPRLPAFLVAVAACTALAAGLGLPVETVASRFGPLPAMLPAPALPDLARTAEVLPTAVAFALLGGIESLLSAVVADSMTGRRHRANAELVAQGAANVACALFGGIPVTGTIARTATNVRAGARGPVAGMLHALFVLAMMAAGSRLIGMIPLAALAGLLLVVAWGMAEHHAVATLLRASRGDAAVLAVTFLLVVFRDLTEGILVGTALGALLFLHRMAEAVQVETGMPLVAADAADRNGRAPYDPSSDRDVAVHRISGAFFFGAAGAVAAALERIGAHPRLHVIDFAAVPVIDSTAAATIEGFVRTARRRGAAVAISGARPAVRRALLAHGVRAPDVAFHPGLDDALAAWQRPPP
jgi:SulP family sulfate permease